ncbi:tRNA (guanine(46)-N(7))-methyltransferase TrmB [Methylocapsa acidiphila]|uniref:tRNA (guanine(46)-N(7))-methyltransferase TrmB n=1 Tax=Methylocapsa acidiphila TaxID=133552 RepID=UPI00040FA1A0|nr:tRNA (guanine(46)-N(7))-methyltransferase TrmB [Methylocapsa acidiphila]
MTRKRQFGEPAAGGPASPTPENFSSPDLARPDLSAETPDRPRGLYGRRKGKRLRYRQAELLRTVLPGAALDASRPISDPPSLFLEKPTAIWLEIGFGAGEHLAAEARLHPDLGFIGCEAYLNGVAKAVALIEEGHLTNVRLYNGDARAVIEAIPENSLDGVYLLYPDPWPKRRQRKRRFLSDEMLTVLASRMRPGAELRFATDIDDNAGWTLARVLRSPDFRWAAENASDWLQPWQGWEGTRYESKALREERRPVYLTFQRS